MGALYGAEGAEIFGVMTSVNALVVILATPVVTTFSGGFVMFERYFWAKR